MSKDIEMLKYVHVFKHFNVFTHEMNARSCAAIN
jgi:hypothetical protein